MNEALLRRFARLVWVEIGKAENPWFSVTASAPLGRESEHMIRLEAWNRHQIELARRLFSVISGEVAPSEQLLTEALDFLDGC